MTTDNPTSPPSLSTLKANAEEALQYVADAFSRKSRDAIRAYLDALERERASVICVKNVLEYFLERGKRRGDQSDIDKCEEAFARIAELERGCQEPPVDDEVIRKAVAADINQHLIDSLTPDRGYAVPIDNVKKLIASISQPSLTFSDLHYREVTDGVPNDVIAAARLVHEWMASNGYKDWALMDIQARQSLTFSDALRIARGCLDDYEVMDEIGLVHVGGIQTVINALEAAEKDRK